jgi:hypothetical protein
VADLAATRSELQRVATHLLARRRHDVTGRFGLRATPGGFGTPAFGPPDAVEVVRVAGTSLVREVGPDATSTPLDGATLVELAGVVGVDLAVPFSAGHDTPALGDPGGPLALDPGHAAAIADWLDLGWRAIDVVVAGGRAGSSATQLWPEHFDAAAALPFGPGAADRANVGASPGDGSHDEPYLYVGPWGSARPGDPAYWNAPFGAVLARTEVGSLDDAVAFFHRGLDLLGS